MVTKILLTGATGFVGSRLAPALVEAGHDVTAMTRHPETYAGAGTAAYGDVSDADSLREPMAGAEVAYYFVHSLGDDDFVEKDAEAAKVFAEQAATSGVRQIIYLGGLGDESKGPLSAHLRSRRQVEELLGSSGVPVTTLRAAIVVGKGGISWEMTRQLVKTLPVMVVPKWVGTRTQPIGVDDVVGYLVGVAGNDQAIGRVFEIGGPDVLTYGEMLQQAALVMNGRELYVVTVPVLTPGLSSRWLALVTDVDVTTGRNLIDSMGNEVVVADDSIRDVVPQELTAYQEMVRRALEDDRQTEV